ncbi:MAG: lactate permease LctP family transporter [Chitinophagaceae bacterium]|nr:lactate permease LctP family transporter [Chitinophagaceae bacterium]MCW5927195.1 lactate permease LctP family transporter [Chitinophagaceae bacterium]
MKWTQVIDPLNNIALSALLATVPIAFIFWALIIKKMKGYQAAVWAAVIAFLIAVVFYKMPVSLALLSAAHGALYGLFPIAWIIIGAIFVFNISVKSGQFEIIKHFMASISSDRRLQALLIAFSFGSFLEGTAGFGAPVAITAAILIGLGFNPLYAAGICLVANTVPVAFGSVGIPVTVASQVSGIPELAISQMVGRTLPLLSLLLPFYLVVIICGFKRSLEVMPAILVSGISFAFFQWFTSNYLGPALPDIFAGIFSMISLMILLRFWKPATTWRFPDEPTTSASGNTTYSNGQILRAWAPFIIMTLFILTWGLRPVKETLDAIGLIKFNIPWLHNAIQYHDSASLLPQTFKFNFLSASGTGMLIAAFISLPLVGLKIKEGLRIFLATLNQLKLPILTIASVLGFAYIVNNSGISITIAGALAKTGILFPFFAPILGWLGVFITGSDTSSNALFGRLQQATATSIGVDPVVTVSANCSGGVVGKMISPQSIAVAAAAVGLAGKEANLFGFTVRHSFIILFLVCIITLLQAYAVPWVIPTYMSIQNSTTTVKKELVTGAYYLLALLISVIAVYILTRRANRHPDLYRHSERNARLPDGQEAE